MAQQLIFDIVLNLQDNEELNLGALKQNAIKAAAEVKKDEDFDKVRDKLKTACLTGKKAESDKPDDKKPAEPPVPVAGKPETEPAKEMAGAKT